MVIDKTVDADSFECLKMRTKGREKRGFIYSSSSNERDAGLRTGSKSSRLPRAISTRSESERTTSQYDI